MKHIQEQVASWRRAHVATPAEDRPAANQELTKAQAKARITEIEFLLSKTNKGRARDALISEKLGLASGIAAGRYIDPPAAKKTRVAALRLSEIAEKMAPAPWQGPRCGFCGGEVRSGACANESEDWPHPPTVRE